jgi:hypothetical protein
MYYTAIALLALCAGFGNRDNVMQNWNNIHRN